jgi:flagellar basal body P-ring protein FlgI
MNRVALGAAVLAFSALGAQAAYAQSMSLKSAEVSDGAAVKDEQVLNGFGCKGCNISLQRPDCLHSGRTIAQ